jgi:hypothetical protein
VQVLLEAVNLAQEELIAAHRGGVGGQAAEAVARQDSLRKSSLLEWASGARSKPHTDSGAMVSPFRHAAAWAGLPSHALTPSPC